MRTITKGRPPDTCHKHPTGPGVKTETTEVSDGNHRLVQHRCAAPSCRQPLGWEYHQGGGKFEAGPGQYPVEMGLRILQMQWDRDRKSWISSCVLTALLGFTGLWGGLLVATGEPWHTWHTVAAPSYSLLTLGPLIWLNARLKRMPLEATPAFLRTQSLWTDDRSQAGGRDG